MNEIFMKLIGRRTPLGPKPLVVEVGEVMSKPFGEDEVTLNVELIKTVVDGVDGLRQNSGR